MPSAGNERSGLSHRGIGPRRTLSVNLPGSTGQEVRSTAAKYRSDPLSSAFGIIRTCPAQREHGYERLLRGVRDEVVMRMD
jgi:hypothetical protein